ncbi:MAG: hypothetical protein PVF45_04105 [Anaerolineae bacterium]|jgi:hypothetical protein
MRRLKSAWEWLLPDTDEVLVRGRAGLVIATCLGLAAAVLALILTWLVSGDLEFVTAVGNLVFGSVLAGIAALARSGRVGLATWLLVVLLLALVSVDAAAFGLGSPACAGYFVPIVLAACGIGLLAGIGVALLASVVVWVIAWGASAEWYELLISFETSHLTFNAPFYTVLFLLVALMVGFWVRYTSGVLQRDTND